MTIPAGAAVRRLDGVLGKVVRKPTRCSRGMLCVLWDDRTAAVQWQRAMVVYVARHYATAVAWESLPSREACT